MKMPGCISGIELVRELRFRRPESPVIPITASSAVQTPVKAMNAGAYDSVTQPINYDELLPALNRRRAANLLGLSRRPSRSKCVDCTLKTPD